MTWFLTTAIALLLLTPAAFAAAPTTAPWQQQAAGAITESIVAVTYGNGQYVAVTERNGVLTSANGTDWAIQTIGDEALQFRDIAYGNGQFVAVGAKGLVLTSGNGAGWTWRFPDTLEDLTAVAYCGKRFLAMGWNGGIFASPDGAVWVRQDTEYYWPRYSLACGPTSTVAVGMGILVSSDGATWRKTSASGEPEFLPSKVTYGPAGYVLTGLLGPKTVAFTSKNGIDWKPVEWDPAGLVTTLTYAQGQYLAVAMGDNDRLPHLYTSLNGSTWVQAEPGALKAWKPGPGKQTNAIFDIAWGAPGYVAVAGNGGIFYAASGAWPPAPPAVAREPQQNGVRAMAFSGSRYVALGRGTQILTSTDLTKWVSYQWRPAIPDPHLTLWDVAYGNGNFMVVGDKGTILLSTDSGSTWARATSPTAANLKSIAFGAGRFVTVGDGGTVAATPDGVRWVTYTARSGVALASVRYLGATFVAMGSDGSVLSSSDGVA
jgi:photosystem II stability/assembly factor-like uncharacterized protein